MPDIGDSSEFCRLASALEPWLDQVVIAGGWAHRLYRLHPHAQALEYAPLMTLDTDVALPTRLPVTGHDLRQRLLANGFMEEFSGHDVPPATHYHLTEATSGFYAEFLTPLIGSEFDRRNKRKATLTVAGVNSQQLRHIEILLNHPWAVHLDSTGFTGRLQIANPVSYITQKLLIHARRGPEDRAKDILYMHDTLEVFGASLDELRAEWRMIVAPQLHRRHASDLRKIATRLFAEPTDDVRRAASISPERNLSPASLLEACGYGFNQVFQ